jgi:Ca-activated chloride channel family protein
VLGAAPWLLARFHRSSSTQEQLDQFATRDLLPRLLVGRPRRGSGSGRALFAAAWLLLAFALSGPTVRDTSTPQTRSGIDIAVVLDISPSMLAQDLTPSRLQQAKWKLTRLLQHRDQDRIALVAFSANAYTVLPLTTDKAVIQHFVDAMDASLTSRKGSNLSLAVQRANDLLEASKIGSRAIVLLSDGEARQTSDEALHGDSNIPLLIIGAASETGAPVPDTSGNFLRENDAPVISQLQREFLVELAQRSHGVYTDLTVDNSDLDAIVDHLAGLARDNPYESAPDTRQLYQWALAPAVLLFLWWGRPTASFAMLLLAPLFVGGNDAHADPWAEQQAADALKRGEVDRAEALYATANSFNALLGRGVIAYRREQFEAALGHFLDADKLANEPEQHARAAYNAGNALVKLGRLEAAQAQYRIALDWQSNYPRAAFNLNLVTEQRQLAAQRREHDQASQQIARQNGAEPIADDSISEKSSVAQAQSGVAGSAVNSSSDGAATDASPSLAATFAINENIAALLRQRFDRADSVQGVTRKQEHPW